MVNLQGVEIPTSMESYLDTKGQNWKRQYQELI